MNERGLLLWVASFAGVVLLYAAYKGKSPLTVIKTGVTNAQKKPSAGTTLATAGRASGAAGSTGGNGTGHDLPAAGFTGSNGVTDQYGAWYETDAAGNITATLPAPYQSSPGTFIGGTARAAF